MKTEQDYTLPDTDETILNAIRQADARRKQGDWDNGLPVVNVDIPPSVVIDCPLVRGGNIQAKECKACQYFQGVVQSDWNDKVVIPWSDRYGIRCAKPMERKSTMIVSLHK
jgi:hypothetical protein